jgi:hypothetical protein
MAEESLDFADPFDAGDVAQAVSRQAETREQRVAQAQQALRERRNAYLRFFGGTGNAADKRVVLEDLRRFCRGNQTTWASDPREHALLTGRQEVYRRIQDHLELNFDDMWERYSQVPE